MDNSFSSIRSDNLNKSTQASALYPNAITQTNTMNLTELKIKSSDRKIEAGIRSRANYLKFAYSTIHNGSASF